MNWSAMAWPRQGARRGARLRPGRAPVLGAGAVRASHRSTTRGESTGGARCRRLAGWRDGQGTGAAQALGGRRPSGRGDEEQRDGAPGRSARACDSPVAPRHLALTIVRARPPALVTQRSWRSCRHTPWQGRHRLCDNLLTCVLHTWDFAGEEEGKRKKPVILDAVMSTMMWRGGSWRDTRPAGRAGREGWRRAQTPSGRTSLLYTPTSRAFKQGWGH